jgi:HK97 family phage prohead protease
MKPNLTIPLQIKSLSDREFEGHGSVFKNVDLGGDIVVPGAFKKSLQQHKSAGSMPGLFWMHDPSRVAGKWLDMDEDKHGLRVKGVLADTPLGNEIHTLLKMDAVRGLSIGYRTLDQDWDKDGNRLIKEAELWEVSVVSLPMNPLAQVAHVKSRLSEAGEYVPTPREFERILRDVGCSHSVSKRIVAKMFDGEEARDEPDAEAITSDAREETDEEKAIALAAKELEERMLVAAIRRLRI